MSKTSNIVLIGMPGAGKSTLGEALAEATGFTFVDPDLLIEEAAGGTLAEIIAARGLPGFIQYEADFICTLEPDHAIISTGVSVVYSETAMKHMADIGTIVYLRISLEELDKRLGDLQERGVVLPDGISDLADLYAERVPLYER